MLFSVKMVAFPKGKRLKKEERMPSIAWIEAAFIYLQVQQEYSTAQILNHETL